MADFIDKTIGTASRDYSTIDLWEAAIPANLVTADEYWRGYCYDDSDFSDTPVIDSHVTDATRQILLTTADGENHGYAINGGVKIDGGGGSAGGAIIYLNDDYITIENLMITDFIGCTGAVYIYGGDYYNLNNLIAWDLISSTSFTGFNLRGDPTTARNCILVSCYGEQWAGFKGIDIAGSNKAYNCYVYNCSYAGHSHVTDQAIAAVTTSGIAKNCIGMNQLGSNAADFNSTFQTNHNAQNCMDSDSTLESGYGNLLSKVASNQFENPASDFRLKTGADAIKAGVDLRTDFNYDMINQKRGANWDMGPYQLTKGGIFIPLLLNSVNPKGAF